jgi:hypothetical protein
MMMLQGTVRFSHGNQKEKKKDRWCVKVSFKTMCPYGEWPKTSQHAVLDNIIVAKSIVNSIESVKADKIKKT